MVIVTNIYGYPIYNGERKKSIGEKSPGKKVSGEKSYILIKKKKRIVES